MAISYNVLLQKLSGHLGKQLVFKQYGDKTVVSKYPDMGRRKFSSAQLHNQAIMGAANETAQTILADEALRHAAQVRLNVTANKLYAALIREYFSQNKVAGKAG